MSDYLDEDGFRRSILSECDYCGGIVPIIPTLREQVDDIVENFEYYRVQLAMRGLGYKDIPSIDEMKKELRDNLEDVIKRVRETCDQNQVSGWCGWYVWLKDGIINARWSVAEFGWEP